METPIGLVKIGATSRGICLLEFADRAGLEAEIETRTKRMGAIRVAGENPYLEKAIAQLTEYFKGLRKDFEISLDIFGTVFQQKVWEQLQTIPYGTIKTYKEQAVAIGNPKGVRAVAHANGSNPIAIIVPCHRVIGSNQKLTGYAGGLWRKRFLLQLEAENSPKNQTTGHPLVLF